MSPYAVHQYDNLYLGDNSNRVRFGAYLQDLCYSIGFWYMKNENWIDTATYVEVIDGQPYSNVTFTNYDNHYTSGIELEAVFQPIDKLNVLANFSYSETLAPKLNEGNLLEAEMAAPWLAKVLCAYQATPDLQTDLWVYHRSHIKDSFTNDGVGSEVQRLPSHTSVDVGLRYAYNPDLNVRLGVQNLFDDELLVVSHNEAFLDGAPRGERRVYGGLSCRF